MSKSYNTTCRYCGRPIVIVRNAWNKAAGRRVHGNPYLVFHPDGMDCCGPGGQMSLGL